MTQSRRNFSLVEIHSLLVTRCKIRSLLVAKYHSLLVAKFACYSLQKFLVANNHSLLFGKFGRFSLQKWNHFLQLYEKLTPALVFSCELLRNFKNTYSVEYLRTAASENNIKTSTNFLQFFTSIKFFTLIWLSLIELLLNCLIKLN